MPTHTSGMLEGQELSLPDTEAGLLDLAYKMVAGTLEKVSKEASKQMMHSGKQSERKAWAFVTAQMLGTKIEIDAFRLLSTQEESDLHSPHPAHWL